MPNTKNMPPLGCVVRVWWVGIGGVTRVRRVGEGWGRAEHERHAPEACSSSSVCRAVPSHTEHQIQAHGGPVFDVRRMRDRRGVRDERGCKTKEDAPNTKNMPLWACFACSVDEG